jgi:hypothetical protein
MRIKLWATGSATANAVIAYQIPQSSTLKLIQAAIRYNSITDGGQCDLELSYASAREIQTNAAQQSILAVAFESNFVTSGLCQTGVNQVYPVRAPFKQGQFIYLHALIGGTIVYDATFLLHF